eukprot:gene6313-7036_t
MACFVSGIVDNDWWDTYGGCEDQDDYWTNDYLKVCYSLPDSKFIQRVQLYEGSTKSFLGTKRGSKRVSPREQIGYEMLYDIIMKIDVMFALWQKRLTHEWNKNVKVPSEKEQKMQEPPSRDDDEDSSSIHSSDISSTLELALNMLNADDDVLDDWDSSFDEEFARSLEDGDFYGHEMRRQMNARREKKKGNQSKAAMQYIESIEKYHSAFPSTEDAMNVSKNIVMLKSWIMHICMNSLARYMGQYLPTLVMEHIMKYLKRSYTGELCMKVEFFAKTEKFIDVEKLRIRELFAALLDIHSLLFVILFQVHNPSNLSHNKQRFVKLFDIATRKMTLLEDFYSWLSSGRDDYNSISAGKVKKYDFMSGICCQSFIRERSENSAYFGNWREVISCLRGEQLAVSYNEAHGGFVKVYSVKNESCQYVCNLGKREVAIGVAIHCNLLAVLLQSETNVRLAVYDIGEDRKPLEYVLDGKDDSQVYHVMFFLEFGDGNQKLALQYKQDVVVINLGKDCSTITLNKKYEELSLLAVKGDFMFAKDIRSRKPISTAKEVLDISKKFLGIKIFNLKEDALVQVIEHPRSLPNRRVSTWYTPEWTVAVDSDAGSDKFVVWEENIVQYWQLGNGVLKIKDIDLGRRTSSNTKLALNRNIILVENEQSTFDSNYDHVHLVELLFYEIDSSKVCYFETYHYSPDTPDSNISQLGAPLAACYIVDDAVVLIRCPRSCHEIKICRFNVDARAVINAQTSQLIAERREEEMKKQKQEAERKRKNEEKRKKKEEQRLKRLQKKEEKKREQAKRQQQQKMEDIRRLELTNSRVEGVVTDWRGTYGFMQVPGVGSVFIHRSDVLGKAFVNYGTRISCFIQEQALHPRPKAIYAIVV